MSSGLLDFGTGAFQGAAAGGTVGSMFGPVGTGVGAGVGALALGTISLFGGASDRRLENRYNRQQIQLGDLEITKEREAQRRDRERKEKMRVFGTMLGKYMGRNAQPMTGGV